MVLLIDKPRGKVAAEIMLACSRKQKFQHPCTFQSSHMLLEARSFLVQHQPRGWSAEGLEISIAEDLRGEDLRSCDLLKDSAREDLRLEGVPGGRRPGQVGRSGQQRLLPTEGVLQEAGCRTEVQEVSRTERNCHTERVVALEEKNPVEQTALTRAREHIGQRRPQNKSAYFEEETLKAAKLEDTGQGLTTHPLAPWLQAANWKSRKISSSAHALTRGREAGRQAARSTGPGR